MARIDANDPAGENTSMRRLSGLFLALALAVSPIAIKGFGGGTYAAHADLGWCDTCSSIGVPIPSVTPVPHHR